MLVLFNLQPIFIDSKIFNIMVPTFINLGKLVNLVPLSFKIHSPNITHIIWMDANKKRQILKIYIFDKKIDKHSDIIITKCNIYIIFLS